MRLIDLSIITLCSLHAVVGFSVPRASSIGTQIAAQTYGRGSDIWPECNEEPIQLADSFPGGVLPKSALQRLSQNAKPPGRKNILRTFIFETTLDKKLQAIVPFGLLLKGLVRPLDVLTVIGITGYTTILHYLAKSPRPDGVTPQVLALPPQGHVPALVRNPLGHTWTSSKSYDLWLQMGLYWSLVLPTLFIIRNNASTSSMAAARPLFLLCCQALTESTAKRIMSPLPIRILIPIMYNTIRLGPLTLWARQATTRLETFLAVTNVVYWTANLLGFLIPVAAMRYMRAYFLAVEAEQVTTRPGFENSVGLLP